MLRSALVGSVIVAVVVLVAASWVVALVWSLLRFLELIAVGAVSGWIGWRLGVRHARRRQRY